MAKLQSNPLIEIKLNSIVVNSRGRIRGNAKERTSSNSWIRLSKPGDVEAKHLLLIDDVITTGATLSHCIEALSKIPDIKISVFTIFYTPSRA